MSDSLGPMLFKRGVSLAHDTPIFEPSMLKVKSAVTQENGLKADELRLGESTFIIRGQDVHRLQNRVSAIMKGMEAWPEITNLRSLFLKLAESRDKIEEEVEVLTLKRAFPGRCRLCPV